MMIYNRVDRVPVQKPVTRRNYDTRKPLTIAWVSVHGAICLTAIVAWVNVAVALIG